MLKRLLFFIPLWILVACFLLVNNVFVATSSDLPSVTIINLIRGNELGHEKDNILSSLKDQYMVTKDSKVNATWLLQYSVLENPDLVKFAKDEMEGQELGLLFEIDRNTTEKSKVQFRGQGPWYFSDGLLLPSYDVNERKRIIDTSFKKFKESFGFYPKTVGAWWIGADSLTYMQEKYGITSTLRAADQFHLDFYSIWGGPWSIPYVSSKENQSIPANSWEEGTKVVNLQWATRDPVSGYKDPLFSVQDYPIKSYDTTYVDHLSSTFLKSKYDNLVFGLENGGDLEVFNKFYKTSLDKAKEWEETGKARILLAKDFAKQYLDTKEVFPNTHHFLSKDYQSNNQSFWYISKNYRVGILKNTDGVYLVDLQKYSDKIKEDFYFLNNSQSVLRTRTPYLVDSLRSENKGELLSDSTEELSIKESGETVTLMQADKILGEFSESGINLADKKYNFSPLPSGIQVRHILLLLYFGYFLLILFIKRNLVDSLPHILFLLVPLLLSLSFLKAEADLTYFFDRKESILMSFLPVNLTDSIVNNIYVVKILPFIFLLVSHFLFVIRSRKILNKYIFIFIFSLISYLYLHTPYFPLDRSTYLYVGIFLAITTLNLFYLALIIYVKTKSKRVFIYSLLLVPIVIVLITSTLLVSRVKYILTPFETEALQVIKSQEKDVLVVYQTVHNVRPIYKAVKPLIYENNRVAESFTGKNWETVIRPEDNVLRITGYENKLIVVPRYFGSDFSNDEKENLEVKKIFDNVQVVIYEKN